MLELKTVVPGQLALMAQPSPKDLASLADHGFKTLISNRPDGEMPGQPTSNEIRDAAEEHGLRYVYVPVTLNNITRQDVDAFLNALKHEPSPAIAHCGTGKRSYLLWAAGEVLYNEKLEGALIERAEALGLNVQELPQIVEQIRQNESRG